MAPLDEVDLSGPDLSPAVSRVAESREESYTRDILARVQANEAVSQRSLARELGIALGLANLLLRRMANKGLIRLVRVRPNRVLYFITPAGIAEKARMTVAYVARNVQSYRETRDRIRTRFGAISREPDWPDPADKRVAFCGADEVAEIGYVCLQGSDLRLTGVVDHHLSGGHFFGLPVRPLADLSGLTLAGEPFDRLVVMSLMGSDALLDDLRGRRLPPERVFWLL